MIPLPILRHALNIAISYVFIEEDPETDTDTPSATRRFLDCKNAYHNPAAPEPEYNLLTAEAYDYSDPAALYMEVRAWCNAILTGYRLAQQNS